MVLTNADEISGYEIRAHDFLPFPVSESLDVVRGNAHCPELGQSSYSLLISETLTVLV